MSLLQSARLLRWRWARNGGSRIRYLFGEPRLSGERRKTLEELQQNGIAVRRNVGDAALFQAMREDARRLYDKVWDGRGLRKEAVNWANDRSDLPAHEAKDFLVRLIPPKLAADSAYVRYALQEELLSIADAYLGMYAQLRAVHLWLNYPTGGEARSTQLWHRDADDVVNLKAFTYLSDVDEWSGPFAFIPQTHPFGRRRGIAPRAFQPGRIDDPGMAQAVARDDWRVNTGPAGTTVFADTCGYHKGVKPEARPRLMLMCHYTSQWAASARDLTVTGSLAAYTPRQRAAVAAARE
jgi:hypothetical protein